MVQFYDGIPDEKHVEWIKEQKLFHVATAPLNGTFFSCNNGCNLVGLNFVTRYS